MSRKIFPSPPTPAIAASVLALAAALLLSVSVRSQVESVENAPQNWVWATQGQAEGHLALNYSPAGAFSPDGSTLAVVGENKILLMNLGNGGVRKVLRPRLENTANLQFQSANFLDPNHLLLLAVGLIQAKGEKPRGTTPLLAFQWDIDQDALSGKVNAVGSGGGFAPPVYFPLLRHLVLYKDGQFILWNAATGQGARINIPALTRQPRVYDFSFDGHWLLLAQIEASSTADPLVVRLRDHQFVDSLRGHQGTVLSIAFSRDNQKVATTCEDGKIRIWSVSEWKLLQTLAGHQGPVHWADFSPDGKWLASAGEDATVRIWSVEDGKLLQTLEKARAPVLTVAFSAGAKYLAASTERTVLIWKREAG